jgi:hypothetical protein
MTGWLWLKDGFAIFRKQPFELSSLFVSYLFLMILIGIVPLLGQILPVILLPTFSLAFLQASKQVRAGEKVHPRILFAAFRSPALKRLLWLGVLQMAAALLAIGLSVLVDGGLFWKIMSGQIALDPKVVADSNMGFAMLVAALVYLPTTMAFWFAPPLIAWQDMGVGKAVFYSFFAVRRETRAFAVYGVAWALVGILAPMLASLVLALLFNSANLIVMLMVPLSLLLTVVLYCSFYSSWFDVFGVPDPIPAALDVEA